jgi:hypothetical protein
MDNTLLFLGNLGATELLIMLGFPAALVLLIVFITRKNQNKNQNNKF